MDSIEKQISIENETNLQWNVWVVDFWYRLTEGFFKKLGFLRDVSLYYPSSYGGKYHFTWFFFLTMMVMVGSIISLWIFFC